MLVSGTARVSIARWNLKEAVKPSSCTEHCDVDATGISVTVSASYPGRSAWLPRATSILAFYEVYQHKIRHCDELV